MWSIHAVCDELFVHSRLYLKLELEPTRETAVQYFDQVRRAFPHLGHLRRRDDGGYVLEEEGTAAQRRSLRLERSALKFTMANPPDARAVLTFADRVLTPAPTFLTLSELDYDYMEVQFGFDLEYRGNHDQLVAETLLKDSPMLAALAEDAEHIIDCQPFFGLTISADCQTQVFVEVKGRTTTFEVRSGEYEASALSVHVTARRYRGAEDSFDILNVHRDLLRLCERFARDRVIPHVVQPLAAAIASGR